MGDEPCRLLSERGFSLLNDTPLPVVCFTHPRLDHARDGARVVEELARSGTAWISQTRLRGATAALRACITNVDTQRRHLEELVAGLEQALRR
jgi:glutamate/tyrosine decarboxylase-like PLP-dependent enzyme